MGMAAGKRRPDLVNAQRVVGPSCLCAAQGLEFLKPWLPAGGRRALPEASGLSLRCCRSRPIVHPRRTLERVGQGCSAGRARPGRHSKGRLRVGKGCRPKI